MKFATLRNGSRDGQLLVVSRDLTRAVAAPIAPSLLDALERWDEVSPALAALYERLNNDPAAGFAFDQRACAAPLPRANQWLDASTYGAHGRLMKASLKLERQPHADFPLLLQGMPSDFLGPFDDEPLPSDGEDINIDFEAEIGVITGAVPARPTRAQAGAGIKLLVMLCDWTLRGVVPQEIASGFGFMRAKAPVAFAAVAVTPDEAAHAWQDFRLNLRVKIWYNGKPWGNVSAAGMDYGFDHLVQEVATNRRVLPGTIIGSGSVSEGAPEKVGASNVAEMRGHEILTCGAASSPYVRFGDKIRMETYQASGATLFGAIEQQVVRSA